MRPQQQNRRMRGRNNNNNNNNRRGPNPLTRNYESNGPDVKIRGSAQQIAEKYTTLARDAQSSGDRVMADGNDPLVPESLEPAIPGWSLGEEQCLLPAELVAPPPALIGMCIQ